MTANCLRSAALLIVTGILVTGCGTKEIFVPVPPVGPPEQPIGSDTVEPRDVPPENPEPDPVEPDPVEPDPVGEETLPGGSGALRFHLKFDNETEVDLDLHVKEPGGEKIDFEIGEGVTSNGGRLDVDCRCGYCDDGPNENIFWPDEVNLPGEYKYWVKYYDYCPTLFDLFVAPSNYTLYVMVDGEIVKTHEGTLAGGKAGPFYFQHE